MNDLLMMFAVESALPLVTSAATFVLALALIRLAIRSLNAIRAQKPIIK